MLYENLVVRTAADGYRVALWKKDDKWIVRTSTVSLSDPAVLLPADTTNLVEWGAGLFEQHEFDVRRDAVTRAHEFFLDHGGLG